MHLENDSVLEELTTAAMGRVLGGDLAPTEMWYAPAGAAWIPSLYAALRWFVTLAPASSYAYGKVGYSS